MRVFKQYAVPPCKDCLDRCVEPNCHTNCKRYLEYKEIQDRLRVQHQVQSQMMYSFKENENEYYRLVKKHERKLKRLKVR